MTVKVKCKFPMSDLLLATRNIQDGDGNWQNKILNISSLSRNIGEDKSYEISGMSIELNDSDRFFRKMMSGDNRYIAGKSVEIKNEDNSLIYTGNVEKWEFQEDSFSISINDKLSGLDKVIPHTLTKEEYENAVDEADGTSIPIIYGYVYADKGAVKCMRVDTTLESGVTKGIYLLADHHCFSLRAAYKEDGTDISGDCVLSNLGTTGQEDEKAFVIYNIGVVPEGEEVEYIPAFINVDVEGKMKDAALIEHPLDALEDIIDNYTAMTLSGSDLTENYAIMSDRGYKIAAVIIDQKTLGDVLIAFAYSFDCDFYLSKGNEIVIALLNWDNPVPAKYLDENLTIGFQIQELPDEIRNKIKYNYRYDYAHETYQRSPLYEKPGSIANWGEFYNKNEPLELKYVYDEATALDVVQRFALQKRNPKRIAVVDLPLAEFSGLDISDVVEIEHPGAIDDEKRKYQIRRVNIDFTADAVQMECIDITSLTGGIFILGDDSFTDNWDDPGITDYERQFAYLCDEDGFFANDVDEGKILY